MEAPCARHTSYDRFVLVNAFLRPVPWFLHNHPSCICSVTFELDSVLRNLSVQLGV